LAYCRLPASWRNGHPDKIAGPETANYHLLVRIAEGLDIPRERMGLSW
jgi:hypothetical protein